MTIPEPCVGLPTMENHETFSSQTEPQSAQIKEEEKEHLAESKEVSPKEIDYLGKLPAEVGTDYTFKRDIVWFNAIGFLILHVAAVYGLWVMVFHCYWKTDIWALLVAFSSGMGVTTGAHRLFSHKSYKAPFITRLVLILWHTLAGQNCLYIWVRDHRQHHKYSDTDADPHNANRGFFFSHVGWLMSRKHPAVIAKGRTIDMSDMEADWLVMFQKEHYKVLYTIFAIFIPTVVPVFLWNESWWNSFFAAYMFRSILVLNITWLVNSAAHFYGTQPFDKYVKAVESGFVSFVSVGEGWHNYHHAFPWDYRAAEFGARYSITTFIIDTLAFFGLAYDLKTTPYYMVQRRAERTGDGSHPIFGKMAEKLEETGKLDDEDIAEIVKSKDTSGAIRRLATAQG
ncbi:acyl-CoA Delta-9 desaturase-like isoform X2 [Anthonomus grandis grandis]|nr:acyl-CoA Delta-9 desaturase-like isoform X2 [Anthonomus grandis grandis]XP_050294240.1 acyl-CoA Delta-9 desaturase-like isoform X2 [Anthonomus grandis grandis]XP_050294241.1 acyl-CoA Delta-9 desaturase-like isoform X2 [Anthonomus grandis grandis]